MKSLVNNYTSKRSYSNSYAYAIFIGLLIYAVLELDLYYVLAITIFAHQFFSLYMKLGDKIPVRNLIGVMFSLNYLLSPVLIYLWLYPYTEELYTMKVDPQIYFSYAIPAILLFLIGLNIGSKAEEEQIDEKEIESITDRYPQLPIILIVIGIGAGFLKQYVPSFLIYIFYTLSYLKVVGFFLSLFSKKGFNIWYLILSYGLLTFESVTSSMWNDFLNILFFLGFFLCLRYKPSQTLKIGGIFAGILLVFFIQMIKMPLRSAVGAGFNIEKFSEAVKEGKSISDRQTSGEKLVGVVFRLNQGWFFSSTMSNYQQGGFNFQKGNHSVIVLQTAVLPKFLAPNRIDIGDPVLFNKYSGYFVDKGTSMALGVLSDGFIDFGYNGIFVVFAFGLILNCFIKFYHKMNDKYLFAKILSPLGLFYIIRPDIDTQGALGGVLKSAIILWVLLIVLQNIFSKDINKANDLSPS